MTVAETLERIAQLNPSLNAYTSIASDALEQEQRLNEERKLGHVRGPLHGRTISIKDLIDVKGMVTTAASRVLDPHPALTDAPVVARLREAGAVIIGKCNLHEFALGTTSDESAFGATHNPRDLARSAGGSSGGSAAAVAAGLCWASIGSDTGGSIRIPAAACGVVGLKPGFGEISTAGVVPLSVSLDHLGPITSSVADAWDIYEAIADRTPPSRVLRQVASLQFGVLGGYFLERVDSEVEARFREALDRLRSAGVRVSHLSIAHTAGIARTYAGVALPEAYAYHARMLEQRPDGYSEGVRTRLLTGRNISAADYIEAQGVRGRLRNEVDRALRTCDALVLPTLPIPAPLLGSSTVSVGGSEEPVRPLTLRLTQLFNLTGHPAISVPCDDTATGLPCGFQLVGRRHQTSELLGIALAAEPFITPRRNAGC